MIQNGKVFSESKKDWKGFQVPRLKKTKLLYHVLRYPAHYWAPNIFPKEVVSIRKKYIASCHIFSINQGIKISEYQGHFSCPALSFATYVPVRSYHTYDSAHCTPPEPWGWEMITDTTDTTGMGRYIKSSQTPSFTGDDLLMVQKSGEPPGM